VPELGVEVKRAENVRIQAEDLDGNPVTIDAEGILARALQHELDHLEGATILDHASALKRRLYQRRAQKEARRRR
jgi:peptide deformylase